MSNGPDDGVVSVEDQDYPPKLPGGNLSSDENHTSLSHRRRAPNMGDSVADFSLSLNEDQIQRVTRRLEYDPRNVGDANDLVG